ncbi:trehalose-phosphatase [Cellulosimicrobium terreum]|nr:trehalose-phosphatase [Cellulosimicrobium terreum]
MSATPDPTLPDDLVEALDGFCQDPGARIVALDFDGTLAPLVDDPTAAVMDPAARAAFDRLADAVRGTTTRLALVSGRNLTDLAERGDPAPGTLLVGSHGAETGRATADGVDAVPLELTPVQVRHLADLRAGLAEIAAGREGVWVQDKPSAAVLHTRLASDDQTRAVVQAADDVAARLGLHAMHGKDVVEIAVVHTSKGEAIARLRDVVGHDTGTPGDATRVLYAGDDTTDETALRTLGPGDVGIKVGDGPTAAAFRVADPAGLAAVLDLVSAAHEADETRS